MPYLSYPDSELDVLYMDLDLLDEAYPMGKSNLPFKDFGQGGLTGVEGGLTGLAQTCHFLVSTGSIGNSICKAYCIGGIVTPQLHLCPVMLVPSASIMPRRSQGSHPSHIVSI
jgi:hypothetical protein